ncbi:MAG: TetR/AcrR family transcriptional regulator [Bacteroidales bacterium]
MGVAERKEREKQQRKEEIVKAAEEVFFSKGFDKSTMDDIAEQAELSKGTLYLYFKSKEDLHMAVAHKAVAMLSEEAAGIEDGEGSALEKLVRLGRAAIEFYRKFPDHMKSIIFLEGFEMQQLSFSASEFQDVIYTESPVGMVVRIVEQGVHEKLIRSDIPPLVIAHTLWMQMISVMRFVTNRSIMFQMLELSPSAIYESHFEVVINGIRV